MEVMKEAEEKRHWKPICCPFCGGVSIMVHPQLIDSRTGDVQTWLVGCQDERCKAFSPIQRPWHHTTFSWGFSPELKILVQPPEIMLDNLSCTPMKGTLRITQMPRFTVQNMCVRWSCTANGKHQVGFQDLPEAKEFYAQVAEKAIDPVVRVEVISSNPCRHRSKIADALGFMCMRPGVQGERSVHLNCDCGEREE